MDALNMENKAKIKRQYRSYSTDQKENYIDNEFQQ